MAAQGYGTSPGRNSGNSVGTSKPRSVTTKAVPIILSQMPGAAKKIAAVRNVKKGKSK